MAEQIANLTHKVATFCSLVKSLSSRRRSPSLETQLKSDFCPLYIMAEIVGKKKSDRGLFFLFTVSIVISMSAVQPCVQPLAEEGILCVGLHMFWQLGKINK